ncbi:MAG: UDP-3-O-(3-hydroxymyristoyl)glucosamine N-acyltransferase [Moraxellaceae bacterium]|nr:MAG: UDP-3-O-(3-hydroxymyristoyl)glucosamine N-acyltransferase [Moraxellaceae bacterium]
MNDQKVASSKRWTLKDLAKTLDAKLVGEADQTVAGFATLEHAMPGQISFLANASFESQLAKTQATAVIIHPRHTDMCPVSALIVDNPYLTYAKASHLFDVSPVAPAVIHPSAVIHPQAIVAANVAVGANVIIEEDVEIAAGAVIGPGCVVGANSVVGANTRLHANVTLYHRVIIGENCIVHSGVVLGGDGFGFANEDGKWQKIAQLGGVTIGNFVDIGANTTIDRGAIENTLIGDHVILDNQIQIAHNVEIGEGTAIAGCTGIAGSTKIGKYCTIAGAVGIAGHLQICDGVHITMRSAITRSITESGSYSSGTAMSRTQEWRKNAARFRQLDGIVKRIRTLERALKKL